MPAITITDLDNAKIDVDHIAAIATSASLTATDRLGRTKRTMDGAIAAITTVNNRGAWAGTTEYLVIDIVLQAGTWYICVVAHTSAASFATDVASKWRVYQGITEVDLAADDAADDIGWVQDGAYALGRPLAEKIREVSFSAADFASLDDAVDDCPDGGTIDIPIGVFGPLSAPLTKSIRFRGAKKPKVNSGETGLEDGSIIIGPLIYLANNCSFEDIGVDSGSTVCTTYYAGVAQEGLICTVAHGSGTYTGNNIKNVVSIAKDTVGAVHTFAAEMQENCTIDRVTTYKGLYGAVFKVAKSNVTNIVAIGAGTRGIYIKRDELSLCEQSNFTRLIVNCRDVTLYGMTLESRRSDDAVVSGNMFQINISQFIITKPVTTGIIVQGSTTATDQVTDCLLENGVVFGNAASGVSGMQRIGKLKRVKTRGVRFLSCPLFGMEDFDDLSFDNEISGCDAVSCGTGFKVRGNGTKLHGNHAESCVGFGYYLAGTSAVYRSNNTGRSNGSGDFGGDGTSPWFELGAFLKAELKTPSLLNSWVDNGGTFQGARYSKSPDGYVHLHGAIKSGTLNTAAFVLPVAYRPTHDRRFIAAGLAAGVLTPVDLFIETNGNVIPVQGTNAFVSLDGVSFVSPDTDPV